MARKEGKIASMVHSVMRRAVRSFRRLLRRILLLCAGRMNGIVIRTGEKDTDGGTTQVPENLSTIREPLSRRRRAHRMCSRAG